ncbi:hypothetical protein O181_087124 [Austropuccinia psidii MF-1]|uniref:Uncharacterized protein n=1 Tax=Austropuccinia psidii MF-1 TaxID=1389203 RepID=A0A9Q3IP44_9BASI|nr:hypothetical protein [Austropuccinia psidii MF-1]
MTIISEAELELSMSNSKRDKSHSKGSNRHIYDPLRALLHGLQGQRLGNLATNPPRSDELASNSKPQVSQTPQEEKKNKKKNLRKAYCPSYRIPRIQKGAMEHVFNMARTLMEFKEKEEKRRRKSHFAKK